MPKHLIKRFTPNHEKLRNHKHMRLFGRFLLDPNLWHMNRRSISGAFGAGLFWAMIPIPLQMLAAAASAIIFRVNLPVSVALVWLTNPITMPPLFYFNYLVGTWVLGKPTVNGNVSWTLEWLADSLHLIWQPLYLGSLIVGAVSGGLGYLIMRLFWRWHAVKRWEERRTLARTARHSPTAGD